jgi:hypothetical protein
MVNGRLPAAAARPAAAAARSPGIAARHSGIALKSNAGQIRIIQILEKSAAHSP